MTSTVLDPDKVIIISRIRRACGDGRLRAAIAEARISSFELGRGIGTNRNSISRWMNGHDLPTPALALRLAEFLDQLGVGITE